MKPETRYNSRKVSNFLHVNRPLQQQVRQPCSSKNDNLATEVDAENEGNMGLFRKCGCVSAGKKPPACLAATP